MSDKSTKSYIEDSLITGFNELKFAITEPLKLRVARLKHAHKYQDPNQTPLVSVCVPTYNRGSILIERAVTDVLAQTYKNLELVIVGDHCTDNTAELIADIKDSRVRFHNLPTRDRKYPQTIENHWFVGGAIPGNKAMQIARGDWIARIDDDDNWTPDHIEKLLRFAQQGQFEFVSGLYVVERNGKHEVVDVIRAEDPHYTRKELNLNDDSPKIGGVQTWLYRTYLRCMPYNPECWRKEWNKVWDVDLSLRIYKAGTRIGFLDDVVAKVQPRPGESFVGLEAYKRTEKEKLDQYKFTD